MSKHFSLKDFQNLLTQRLQTASKQSADNSRLGFRVCGQNWLVNLAEINEVLPLPITLPVPGARRWFRGVANIRGNLYAVSDLGDFLFGKPTPESASNRLLLAHSKLGVNSALLVEQTLGLRHRSLLSPNNNAALPPFASHCFQDAEGANWTEIQMTTLLTDASFLMAAEA